MSLRRLNCSLLFVDARPQAWMSMRKAKEEAEAGGASTSVAGLWKFSKNTQAWLLRHLFSEDQVKLSRFSEIAI